MLDEEESRVGQYGFYTAPGILHRVGHLMPALCTTQLHNLTGEITTTLARGNKKKVGLHVFFQKEKGK